MVLRNMQPRRRSSTGSKQTLTHGETGFPAEGAPNQRGPGAFLGTPIVVYEPDGKAHRALYHLGRWMTVETRIDEHTGERRTVMNGGQVSNPVVFVSS